MKIVIDIPKEMILSLEQGSFGAKYNLYDLIDRVMNGTPLPKCNECKYYEGVHKVQGHAPCSYHTIGGVMWDWYCSQFEADKENII